MRRAFASSPERMPAMRVMVNTPSPQGSVGITTNLLPSMTLGCGAAGGNSTSDNVGPLHLINIKRLAYAVRRPEDAYQVPPAAAPRRRSRSARRSPPPSSATWPSAASAWRWLRPQPVRRAGSGSVTAEIVDRFLASRARAGGRSVRLRPQLLRGRGGTSRLPKPARRDQDRRFRLRERRARGHARLPQDLHRPEDDRDAGGPRSGGSHDILVLAQR